MTMAFDRTGMRFDDLSTLSIIAMDTSLQPWDTARLRQYKELWNFYEGYHWEGIPFDDKPQVTVNYCRRFVDKFVAFMTGDSGFTISVDQQLEDVTLPFLNEVWESNHKDVTFMKLAQSGSVTGDAYLRIFYAKVGTFDDPFGEYPNGKIQVYPMPSHTIFPVWDSHDRTRMVECIIKYPLQKRFDAFLPPIFGAGFFPQGNSKYETILYKQVWTANKFQVWEGSELIQEGENPYGFIPIVHIPNYPMINSNYGISDIMDLVPMNIELNEKMSDISEIIDYHSSPITIVKGAKIGQLEKGANKVWGNLPKDSDVHNLEMTGDLSAATKYIDDLKQAMFEVGNVPEIAIGGADAISNTSGIALQVLNAPIIERTRVKRNTFGEGLKIANKMILVIAIRELLIQKPQGMKLKDFLKTDIVWSDSLPKDELLELQEIQLEMQLGLESKKGALERINNNHEGLIEEKMKEIQDEKMEDFKNQLAQQKMQQDVLGQSNPQQTGDNVPKSNKGQPRKVNSGVTNGPTPSPTSNNTQAKLQPFLSNEIEGKQYDA